MEQVLSQTAELTVSKVSAKALVAAPATQPLPTADTSTAKPSVKSLQISAGARGCPHRMMGLGKVEQGTQM